LGRACGGRWVTLKDGLEQLRTGNKPGMVVIHKSWCGACKSLGPRFASSSGIQALADKFVMINIQDDDEGSEDARYMVDGGYIPRIYFVGADGNPLSGYTSQNPQYKYFFGTDAEIAATMKRVLDDWHAKDL